jgi:hypothetical protein
MIYSSALRLMQDNFVIGFGFFLQLKQKGYNELNVIATRALQGRCLSGIVAILEYLRLLHPPTVDSQ